MYRVTADAQKNKQQILIWHLMEICFVRLLQWQIESKVCVRLSNIVTLTDIPYPIKKLSNKSTVSDGKLI
jgi:hypothetical protein